MIANYNLGKRPKIFENRIRWYRSNNGDNNPVFYSDYDIVFEENMQEPDFPLYSNELEATDIKSKSFYYFEARPYTFAGRIEHFRNEHRILVMDRSGSVEWQDFMEDIYFERQNMKNFNHNGKDVYLDIF